MAENTDCIDILVVLFLRMYHLNFKRNVKFMAERENINMADSLCMHVCVCATYKGGMAA